MSKVSGSGEEGGEEGGGSPAFVERVCGVCGAPLANLAAFFKRYRVCREHATAPEVDRDGVPSRFCQQCGRFHELAAFDGQQRSCREQLAYRSKRRKQLRAQQQESGAGGSGATSGSEDEGERRGRKRRAARRGVASLVAAEAEAEAQARSELSAGAAAMPPPAPAVVGQLLQQQVADCAAALAAAGPQQGVYPLFAQQSSQSTDSTTFNLAHPSTQQQALAMLLQQPALATAAAAAETPAVRLLLARAMAGMPPLQHQAAQPAAPLAATLPRLAQPPPGAQPFGLEASAALGLALRQLEHRQQLERQQLERLFQQQAAEVAVQQAVAAALQQAQQPMGALQQALAAAAAQQASDLPVSITRPYAARAEPPLGRDLAEQITQLLAAALAPPPLPQSLRQQQPLPGVRPPAFGGAFGQFKR